MVAVLGVLLHPLQVLLVTLEAPGVVCELRDGVAVAALQTVVEHLGLLQPLQLHVLRELEATGHHKRERALSVRHAGQYSTGRHDWTKKIVTID